MSFLRMQEFYDYAATMQDCQRTIHGVEAQVSPSTTGFDGVFMSEAFDRMITGVSGASYGRRLHRHLFETESDQNSACAPGEPCFNIGV